MSWLPVPSPVMWVCVSSNPGSTVAVDGSTTVAPSGRVNPASTVVTRSPVIVIDTRSRTLYALDDLERNSVDYYAALRSAYTQQRAEIIRQKREKTNPRAELERRDNLALIR